MLISTDEQRAVRTSESVQMRSAVEDMIVSAMNALIGQIPGHKVPLLPVPSKASDRRGLPKGIEHMQLYRDITGYVGEYRKIRGLLDSFNPHPDTVVVFVEQHLCTRARVRYQISFLAIANLENNFIALFTKKFHYPRSQKCARKALLRAEKGIAEVRSFFPESRSSLSVPDLRMPLMASALIENPEACVDAQCAWRPSSTR